MGLRAGSRTRAKPIARPMGAKQGRENAAKNGRQGPCRLEEPPNGLSGLNQGMGQNFLTTP